MQLEQRRLLIRVRTSTIWKNICSLIKINNLRYSLNYKVFEFIES